MRALTPAGAGIFLAACLWTQSVVAGEPDLWLEVDVPVAGATQVGPVGLVLVRGFAGVGPGHDVVLLIDTSGSTFDPAGYDVDGDGRVGRRLRSADDPHRSWNPRRQCSDPGDSVRAAEFAAAKELAAALAESGRARLAVVSFDGVARTIAPLGDPTRAVADAVTTLEGGFRTGRSDLAGALEHAAAILSQSDPSERSRAIILLSDGLASRRGVSDAVAHRQATSIARRLGERSIPIHAFGLGASDGGGPDRLAALSSESGGHFVAVPEPAELVARLLQVELAPPGDLELRNASADLPARAVRVLPDGAFDGIVPLVPGENRIEVVARWRSGAPRRIERTVLFEPRPAQTLEEARAVAADLDELRRRTLELELAATVERGRLLARERVLELEAARTRPGEGDGEI